MTAAKVVDTSAIAAVLFLEPEGAAVASRLEQSQLAAPRLITFELVNVCWLKCRRHPDLKDALTAQLQSYGRLNIEEHPVDLNAVLAIALDTDLTAYDAAYLWLARNLSAELVTLDKALMRATAAGPPP